MNHEPCVTCNGSGVLFDRLEKFGANHPPCSFCNGRGHRYVPTPCNNLESAVVEAAIHRRKSGLQLGEVLWEWDDNLTKAVDALIAAREDARLARLDKMIDALYR